MRRLSFTIPLVLLFATLTASPAAAQVGSPTTIHLNPVVESKEIGGVYVATVIVRDAAGESIEGVNVDFRVQLGPHAEQNLDGIAATPPGVFGECVTTQAGCQRSFVGSFVGVDSVRAFADINDDDALGTGELQALVPVTWFDTDLGTKRVRLDAAGCNGDLLAPINEDEWTAAAPATPVMFAGVHTVCAARFAADDAPRPGPVTLSILAGPGRFTDSTGTRDLGRQVLVDLAGGYNVAFLSSQLSGLTTLRAEAEGFSAIASKAWIPGVARTLSLRSDPVAPTGTTRPVNFFVRDAFGNGVPGVSVGFFSTGVGRFDSGLSSADGVSGPDGIGQAFIYTNHGELGVQMITAQLDGATTDCELAAGAPQRAPAAGVCAAGTSVAWGHAATLLTAGVGPTTGVIGTPFRIAGTLTSAGVAVPFTQIRIERRSAGQTGFLPLTVATTDSLGRYAIIDRPSTITDYRGVFAGTSQYVSSLSPIARAGVRVGVLLNVPASAVALGSPAVLTGRVIPDHPGTSVRLQQFKQGAWHTISSTKADAASRYAFRIVRSVASGLLFRTLVTSDADHLWNASANKRVNWR